MKTTATILAALTAATALQAQVMQTEITVDRTVLPQLAPSSPLSSVRITLPAATGTATLAPSPFDGDLTLSPTTDSIGATIAGPLPESTPWLGYASLGYFPVYRLWAQAGYRIIDTKATCLQAAARFGGASYHADAAGERFTISDNNFGIDATLFQTIGSHQLSASLAYAHTALSSPTFMGIKQNQGYNSIVGSVDFGKIRQSYAYSAKLKIDRLAATDKIEMGPRNPYLEPGANTAIDLALNGRISSASGKIGGLLELGLRHLDSEGYELIRWFNEQPAFRATANPSMNIWNIKPQVQFRGQKYDIRVGANVDFTHGTDYRFSSRIAPAVDIAWLPVDRISATVSYNGWRDYNSLRRLFDYSPYITPLALGGVRSNTDIQATVEYNQGVGFRAGASGGYRAADRTAMPLIVNGLEVLGFEAVDMNQLWFKISAGYTFRWAGLDIGADFRTGTSGYSHGNPDDLDRAKIVANAHVALSPVEKLRVRIGWQLRSGRHYYTGSSTPNTISTVDMDAICDINIGAGYSLSERLSLAFDARNLLCRKAETIPGLPGQGLQALLSATYRF